MFTELIDNSNYGYFNITLAHLIGLENSIYLAVLLEYSRKNAGSTFLINRNEVEQKTTFNEKKQKELEKLLSTLNLISIDNEQVLVDSDAIVSLVMNIDNLKLDVDIALKTQTKRTKQQCIIDNLKKDIITSNEELRNAYCAWIDAVYERGLNKTTVTNAQKDIDKFSDRNLDIALEVLNIATANTYKDMTWAISIYNQKHKTNDIKVNSNIVFDKKQPITKPALLSNEVF